MAIEESSQVMLMKKSQLYKNHNTYKLLPTLYMILFSYYLILKYKYTNIILYIYIYIMKYLKKFENLDDGISLYDREYIDLCFVDVDHVVIDVDEISYTVILNIDLPKDEFDTKFNDLVDVIVGKVRIEYPNVSVDYEDDFFLVMTLKFN